MESHAVEPVTVVVTRRVKAGREAEYEAWLEKLIAAAVDLPGYLGTTVHRPRPGEPRVYTAIYRFDSVEHLHGFEHSESRRRALAQVGDFVEADAVFRTATGLELWFTPPAGTVVAQPTRWRMAALMTVVIYVLVLVLGGLARRLMPGVRFELRLAVTLVIEVALMTYLVMPLLTRRLARWIYPRARAPGG